MRAGCGCERAHRGAALLRNLRPWRMIDCTFTDCKMSASVQSGLSTPTLSLVVRHGQADDRSASPLQLSDTNVLLVELRIYSAC